MFVFEMISNLETPAEEGRCQSTARGGGEMEGFLLELQPGSHAILIMHRNSNEQGTL